MAKSIEEIRAQWAAGDAVRDAGLTTPEDIERHDSISYGEIDPWNLLDVYYLKGTDKPRPLIISIHGGGWFYGDKELYSHYCMRLAQRGFTVVNFNYRLAPESKYPAPLEDACAVFRWVAANAEQYYIDINNIFMVGDSAGAQLCQQLCTILTNPSYAALFELDIPKGFKVNACALNCGCYFFPISRVIKPSGMMAEYLPKDYARLLPQFKFMRNITPDFPPAFVMSAANDFLRFMVKPMSRALKRRGVEHIAKIYGSKEQKEVGHVFHVDCRLDIAARCNDEECAFFRAHMV